MNFPNPLSQSTSSTKKTNPDSSRSLLLLSQGTSLTPGSQKDHPRNWDPPPSLPLAGRRKGQLSLLQKMSRCVPLLTFHGQGRRRHKDSGARECPSPLACTPPKAKESTSPRGPAGGCSHEGSLWEAPRPGRSLGLMQPPPTVSGVSSIITPLSLWDLCLNEACFLPDAISFYPGWRLKADQWGQYIWCHFNLQQWPPSLSVCLKYTERSILPKNG